MAPTNYNAVVTNNTSGKKIYLRAVVPIGNPKQQPVISFPLINVSSANTPLFRFIGPSEEIKIACALFDDGQDVSGGDSINTVPEQIQWLRDTIFTENYDDDVTLEYARYYTSNMTGVITFTDAPGREGSPNLVFAQITIRRGRIGNL